MNATTKPIGDLFARAALQGEKGRVSLGVAAAQALGASRQWPKFIVSPDIPDRRVPLDYADQLRAHCLFQLPFDKLVVQFGPYEDPQISERFYIVLVHKKDEAIEGRVFTVGEVSGGVVTSSGKVIWQTDWDLDEWLADTSPATFVPDSAPGLDALRGLYGEDLDKARRWNEKTLFIGSVRFLVGLINAEGIVTEHHPAPKFINKKREAKGKLPLFEYHLLNISPELKMPGHVAAGGSHASPRLHWRRGHVRGLPSGKLTQVKPCLVGNKSLGRIEKDYQITATDARP